MKGEMDSNEKSNSRGWESRGEIITVMWTWFMDRAEGMESGK